jgi:hypothetical protein
MTTRGLLLKTGGPLPAALLLLAGYASAQPPAPTFTTLASGLDGPNPLEIGKGGVLYGSIFDAENPSQAFSLTPPASPGSPWTYTVILGNDGFSPVGAFAMGGGGTLYGVDKTGGSSNCEKGCGLIYSVTPPVSPGGAWTRRTIFPFYDYLYASGVALGPAGVLYGPGNGSPGSLFSLTPPASPGSPWTYNQIYTFTGTSDGTGISVVTISSEGVLYGTTGQGGLMGVGCLYGCGTVFALAPPESSGGSWTLTVLHSFESGSGDHYPDIGPSPLALSASGALYGTLAYGGNTSCTTFPGGCGSVFVVDPPSSPGGPWGFRTIYSFTGGNDGGNPSGGLVIASNGDLIGTASQAGAAGYGTIFALTPPTSSGGAWTETTLYSFPAGSPGNPGSGVIFGPAGALYGVTASTVFSLTR